VTVTGFELRYALFAMILVLYANTVWASPWEIVVDCYVKPLISRINSINDLASPQRNIPGGLVSHHDIVIQPKFRTVLALSRVWTRSPKL
jgi:hypothetical protein